MVTLGWMKAYFLQSRGITLTSVFSNENTRFSSLLFVFLIIIQRKIRPEDPKKNLTRPAKEAERPIRKSTPIAVSAMNWILQISSADVPLLAVNLLNVTRSSRYV